MNAARRVPRVLAALAVALLCATALAPRVRADWTASGDVQYTDREYDSHGYTGNWMPKPIRRARVQVVDANTTEVLATGATDNNGHFAIRVQDTKIRSVYASVWTLAGDTASYPIAVTDLTGDLLNLYTINTPTLAVHAPNADYALPGTMRAGQDDDSRRFNIFDCLVDAVDYASWASGGRRPGHLLVASWVPGLGGEADNEVTPYWNVRIAGARAFDDPETYRRAARILGQAVGGRSTAGTPGNSYERAWVGGWGLFVAAEVEKAVGISRPWVFPALPSENRLADQVAAADLSAPALTSGGPRDTLAIAGALWTIASGFSGMGAQAAEKAVWDVSANAVSAGYEQDMDAFRTGWSARGWGQKDDLDLLLSAFGFEYHPDAWEPDGSAAGATPLALDAAPQRHTIFPSQDLDCYTVDLGPNQQCVLMADGITGTGSVQITAVSETDTTTQFSIYYGYGDAGVKWLPLSGARGSRFQVRVTHFSSGQLSGYNFRAVGVDSGPTEQIAVTIADSTVSSSGGFCMGEDAPFRVFLNRRVSAADSLTGDLAELGLDGQVRSLGHFWRQWLGTGPPVQLGDASYLCYSTGTTQVGSDFLASASALFRTRPGSDCQMVRMFSDSESFGPAAPLIPGSHGGAYGLASGSRGVPSWVFYVDSTGAYARTWPLPAGLYPASNLERLPDGTVVFLAGTSRGRLLVRLAGPDAPLDTLQSALPRASFWLSRDPDGGVLAATSSAIFRLDAQAHVTDTLFQRSNGPYLLDHVARGSDGREYFLSALGGVGVAAAPGNYTMLTTFGTREGGNYRSQSAFALGPAGDIWFTDNAGPAGTTGTLRRLPGIVGADPVSLLQPRATAHHGWIELTWGTAQDSWLDYRVWRAADGETEKQVAAMSGPGIPGFTFRDTTAAPGVEYTYRVAYYFDALTGWKYSRPVRALAQGTTFSLGLPRPNPTRGLSRMSFELPRAGRVRLDIYDVLGRRVRTVLDRTLPAGPASAAWDGLSRTGDPVPSGVYFARLALDTQAVTRKLLVIR